LPIYFSDQFWAQYFVSLFGGIDVARRIHRICAFIMMFAAAYHIITIVGGTLRKIRHHEFDYKRTQLPRLKDLFDLIHDIKYFLGRAPYRPKMEKFMYKQKAHYLAIIWGNFVLIAAGSALLFPDVMAKLFPETLGKIIPLGGAGVESYSAFFQDLARLMHADEAVMALILLAFWHWTNVHVVPGRFPIQWAFLTGKITREHQIEEHFLEYLHNLREIPEEREYMKNLLKELGIDGSKAVSAVDPNGSLAQEADPAAGEKA
jgi:formate dehydrogenase subunit gamma